MGAVLFVMVPVPELTSSAILIRTVAFVNLGGQALISRAGATVLV
jgi:hypothetical protein